MNSYLSAINKINTLIINNTISIKELRKISESIIGWARFKQHNASTMNPKIGEIYMLDFGINYDKEMSYIHRGLVIGVKGQLIHVLPIFSYNSDIHSGFLYNDGSNKTGNLYFLSPDDYPFIQHDSVVRMDIICTLSVARIKKKFSYRFDIHSDKYKTITQQVFINYFPEKARILENNG